MLPSLRTFAPFTSPSLLVLLLQVDKDMLNHCYLFEVVEKQLLPRFIPSSGLQGRASALALGKETSLCLVSGRGGQSGVLDGCGDLGKDTRLFDLSKN